MGRIWIAVTTALPSQMQVINSPAVVVSFIGALTEKAAPISLRFGCDLGLNLLRTMAKRFVRRTTKALE